MRLVERTAPGHVQLTYMWLPTWIGMNSALVREIDEHMGKFLVGKPLTEDTLDSAHDEVIDFLVKRFPLQVGLFDYLDGLKYVELQGGENEGTREAPPAPER